MHQGGTLLPPMEDTPNCWALSLPQYLEVLGIEIALAPTPLSEVSLITHNVVDHLAGITLDQQKLLTAIGIHHTEDLVAPEDRDWMPIAYAQEKLQFTKNITRPTSFEAPENILIRTMMTFQQEDRDQKIHQFLGVISNPTRYCFKICKKSGNRQGIHNFDPDNKTKILLLPGKEQDTYNIISSHRSPSIG